MTAKVRITHYGMEGEGRTLTEAKCNAGQKIEAILSGRWEPRIVSAHGQARLVYRDPLGWWVQAVGSLCIWGSYGTRELALVAAQEWLAAYAPVEEGR